MGRHGGGSQGAISPCQDRHSAPLLMVQACDLEQIRADVSRREQVPICSSCSPRAQPSSSWPWGAVAETRSVYIKSYHVYMSNCRHETCAESHHGEQLAAGVSSHAELLAESPDTADSPLTPTSTFLPTPLAHPADYTVAMIS